MGHPDGGLIIIIYQGKGWQQYQPFFALINFKIGGMIEIYL